MFHGLRLSFLLVTIQEQLRRSAFDVHTIEQILFVCSSAKQAMFLNAGTQW